MTIKPTHLLLVFLQFAILAFLLFGYPMFFSNVATDILIVDAIILGVWAVFSMNAQTISALPDARKEASLTQKGPYKVIRNPMYTAVVEFALGLIVANFSVIRFMLFFLLICVLLIKIKIEEQILTKKYSNYLDYKKSTKKLIPFLF